MRPLLAAAALTALLGLAACQRDAEPAADAAAPATASDTTGMAADGTTAPPQPAPSGGDTSMGATPPVNPDGTTMPPTSGTTMPEGTTTTPQSGTTTTPP
ncbi:MAG: hypothetical protein JNK30_17165 [Phenylobacterium sp.]|uniref:hypothetical protein n=1 Tax=Phenylobacterium sp. TaxID=1871053 RepID=UPI001A606F6F|nr:hypothetical protein [Phenylobacterium sp.]MBL8773114.1 hypothetical protein [Phenylobacterium sp.]